MLKYNKEILKSLAAFEAVGIKYDSIPEGRFKIPSALLGSVSSIKKTSSPGKKSQ
jgi:hypothetical protein